MSDIKNKLAAPLDLVPTLQLVVEAEKLNISNLSVALETKEKKSARIADKHVIWATDGDKAAEWRVGSLAELFRGDKLPPVNMDQYPPEYVTHLFFIERHFMLLNDAIGDRTDQEMEEVYSALRRRPDGRSLGLTHDYIWQVSALLLGLHPLSASEFEALLSALLRSARSWGIRPISRHYASYLRDTFLDA